MVANVKFLFFRTFPANVKLAYLVVYNLYDVKRQGKPITMRDAIDKVIEANEVKDVPSNDIEALN